MTVYYNTFQFLGHHPLCLSLCVYSETERFVNWVCSHNEACQTWGRSDRKGWSRFIISSDTYEDEIRSIARNVAFLCKLGVPGRTRKALFPMTQTSPTNLVLSLSHSVRYCTFIVQQNVQFSSRANVLRS